MKGYKFKVEFVVWREKSRDKAKEKLFNFLLENRNEEGFIIKEPKFIEEEVDPAEKLREKNAQI